MIIGAQSYREKSIITFTETNFLVPKGLYEGDSGN